MVPGTREYAVQALHPRQAISHNVQAELPRTVNRPHKTDELRLQSQLPFDHLRKGDAHTETVKAEEPLDMLRLQSHT